jgi:hypothetical protein
MGAMGAGMNVGAAPSVGTGGLNGPLGDVNAATLSSMSGTRMDQLMELIDGFSSAEILMALMLSAGSCRHKKNDGDDVGLGLLLGLALASQLGHGLPQLPFQSTGVPGPEAAAGQAINLTA